MDVFEFVKDLKKRKVFTVKQSMVIESINIYVTDEEIYKIALHIDPAALKKAKKLGLNQEYILIPLSQKLNLEEKYKKGKHIMIYDLPTNNVSVYEGETTEEQQIDRLKGK